MATTSRCELNCFFLKYRSLLCSPSQGNEKNKFLIGLKFSCLNKYHKIANLWIFQFVTVHLVLSSQKFAGNTYYQNASKDISAFLVFIFENCSGFVASVPLKWINYKFLYIRVTLSYSLEFLYYETAVFDF